MKTKTMIATALLTAGLGLGAASTTADAATWHKGTPRAFKGSWAIKHKEIMYISNKGVDIINYGGNSGGTPIGLKYYYKGNRTYRFHQRYLYGGTQSYTIKIGKSNRRAIVNGYHGVFHKYSSKPFDLKLLG